MHLIFSETSDFSTNNVIDWLIHWNITYLRYNGVSENENEFDFSKCEFCIYFDNENDSKGIYYKNINIIKEAKSIWFRRPKKTLKDFYSPNTTKISLIPNDVLDNWLKPHFRVLKEFVVDSLSQKKVLGSYTITGLNKPQILSLAKKNGLEIPKTIITNSFSVLQNFFQNNNNKIISKALHECINYFPENKNYGIIEYTNLIEDIKTIPNIFATSIFQEFIEKEYEIRIVYLDKELYAMAIFSQNNNKTKIDFRNYDKIKPNRMVPYRIDESLKQNLICLMKEIGLNMGSIDLLKAKNGKIYFLEINPVGQYDFVSYYCNYNIDHEIANFLIKDEKR